LQKTALRGRFLCGTCIKTASSRPAQALADGSQAEILGCGGQIPQKNKQFFANETKYHLLFN
jgi:hypothetical protein